MSNWIELTAADGFVFPCYRASPQALPKGAIVVLQEIFGVNSHVRAVADGYAAAGYLALAPATFHRAQAGVELAYEPEDMTVGIALKTAIENLSSPGVMQDIQAAIDEAAKAGKVGIVGYCWGGLLTWRSACLLKGLSAAVPYYGGGMTTETEAARHPVCPVLAHFGDQDHWIPSETVTSFKSAQPAVQVQVYGANHGFNCDQRASYNEAAAQLARQRSLLFFETHLS